MTAGALSNIEGLLMLKEEYLRLRNPVRSKVAKAVEEKRTVQTYLNVVLAALRATEAEVEKLKDETDVMVAELSSYLDGGLLADLKSKEEENDAFLTEWLPQIEGGRPADSLDAIKTKIRQSFKVQNKLSKLFRLVLTSQFIRKSSGRWRRARPIRPAVF